jgi:hypothetical protein
MIQFTARRENKFDSLRVKLMSSQKIKDASWYLIIGDEVTQKVYALKKLIIKDTIKRELLV